MSLNLLMINVFVELKQPESVKSTLNMQIHVDELHK